MASRFRSSTGSSKTGSSTGLPTSLRPGRTFTSGSKRSATTIRASATRFSRITCGFSTRRTARSQALTRTAGSLAGAGLKGCNDLIFQVVTFLYRIIGNEKVTVYFQLIARKCRISNNRLQNMKNFRDWQILFDRRKNGWINKPLQQQLKN